MEQAENNPENYKQRLPMYLWNGSFRRMFCIPESTQNASPTFVSYPLEGCTRSERCVGFSLSVNLIVRQLWRRPAGVFRRCWEQASLMYSLENGNRLSLPKGPGTKCEV